MQPSQKPEAFDRCIRESMKASCAATLGPVAAKPLTQLRLTCDFPWSLRRSGAPTRTRTWNPLLRRQMLYPVELWVQSLCDNMLISRGQSRIVSIGLFTSNPGLDWPKKRPQDAPEAKSQTEFLMEWT